MKKLLSIFVVLSLFTLSLFAKSELDETAYVIYPNRVHGNFEDNIVVVNKSHQEGISVMLYLKGEGDYEELQEVSLPLFDDVEKIGARHFPSKMRAGNIKEIGIESLDGNVYIAKGYVERGDMYIEIRDEGSNLKEVVAPGFDSHENAYAIDRKFMSGKFDEYIKIKNNTDLKGLTINVYAYDDRARTWMFFGSATVKRRNGVARVKSRKHLGDYRYFVVESADGSIYKYMPFVDDYDLYINVSQ